jgi:bifunctional UDP-N-acetylglucosamine pyrophosphorylase/glucosamine-1-phosphate N-acetyltransferase
MNGCVILAAGLGTRMKGKRAKVLHSVMGKPILEYILDATSFCERRVVVVGYQAEEVSALVGRRADIVVQEKQTGTGDALLSVEEALAESENLLVLCGDIPLITQKTLKSLLSFHCRFSASCTLLGARVDDPTGYGRIITSDNKVVMVVEEVCATPAEKRENLINTGIYCFSTEKVMSRLKNLTLNPKKGEYCLPDVVKMMVADGEKVLLKEHSDKAEVMGVNDRYDLSRVESIVRKRILISLMKKGVTIREPETTYIEQDVKIGEDTTILPQTFITRETKIGKSCTIGPSTYIRKSRIGNRTVIYASWIEESRIGNDCKIGPFAHLRPNSVVSDSAKIGNFVEVKKSRIGRGTKASHLAYIGDAEVGKDVNIGAGTITCNFDGKRKHKTEIGDNAFIGSNTSLIAPIKIGKSATIGAGSVITSDVPERALSLERTEQKIIKKWKRR